MAKEFQSIFDKNRFKLQDLQNKSTSWYWKQVEALQRQRITPGVVLSDNETTGYTRIIPGHLYFYKYDPKTKNEMPYWDQYPMVFPFRGLDDGFIGLNMHYLPYDLRIVLLDNLMDLKNNNRMDHTTKLKLSWNMLKSISKHKLVKPTVHRYLYKQMRSKMISINSQDWGTAMLLPVQRFKKQNEMYVWMESREKATRVNT